MALINCPNCGNKVSDRAKTCPKCGFALQSEIEEHGNLNATETKSESCVYEEVKPIEQAGSSRKGMFLSVVAIALAAICIIISVINMKMIKDLSIQIEKESTSIPAEPISDVVQEETDNKDNALVTNEEAQEEISIKDESNLDLAASDSSTEIIASSNDGADVLNVDSTDGTVTFTFNGFEYYTSEYTKFTFSIKNTSSENIKIDINSGVYFNDVAVSGVPHLADSKLKSGRSTEGDFTVRIDKLTESAGNIINSIAIDYSIDGWKNREEWSITGLGVDVNEIHK